MKNYIKAIGGLPVKAGQEAFNYIENKMTENSIRTNARLEYYNQFQNQKLEKLFKESKDSQNKNSIKTILRKRGYKWDKNAEIFYPQSSAEILKEYQEPINKKQTIKSYKEIEDEFRNEST
ncbi:hypothetical protein [Corticicoccus populi]|uniref:Relaxase n=1 Tax=Corticicoccus populi TaxID=1812821 RepID=A0ABW5WYF3_9STAP